MPTPEAPKQTRIAILGVSGAGKSTLGLTLSKTLHIPHTDLDDLFWQPNWTQLPHLEFLAAASAALPADGEWVVSGVYSKIREVTWERATVIVWLDLPLGVTMRRLVWRTGRRLVGGERCCGGNRERVWGIFPLKNMRKENMFVGAVINTRKRRREWPGMFEREFEGVEVVRLRSVEEVDGFVEEMGRRGVRFDVM